MNECKRIACLFGIAATAVTLTGCAMCNAPIPADDSCNEPSHIASTKLSPENINYTAPKIAPCTDVFKPIFEAGPQRITVVGTGTNLDEATADAIAKFMEKTECDYIVGTTRVITTKTHPTSRFFATTNYSVKLSGIPVTLKKVEKLQPPKPVVKPAPAPAPVLTKEAIKEIVREVIVVQPKTEKKCCPLGMIKLTDINVKVDAKAIAEDPAGLVFPAKKK